MLSKSSTVLAMSGLVRVGRVPDVVVRLFAQRPPLILPAVFAARAHHIHPDARVTFDNDRSGDRLQIVAEGSGFEASCRVCLASIARTGADKDRLRTCRSVSYGLDSVWDPIAGADRAVARDRGQSPKHAVAATPELQKHLV